MVSSTPQQVNSKKLEDFDILSKKMEVKSSIPHCQTEPDQLETRPRKSDVVTNRKIDLLTKIKHLELQLKHRKKR